MRERELSEYQNESKHVLRSIISWQDYRVLLFLIIDEGDANRGIYEFTIIVHDA